jgi:hypothetical protein
VNMRAMAAGSRWLSRSCSGSWRLIQPPAIVVQAGTLAQ